MEIKKLNTENSSAPLAGGDEDRNTVSNSNTYDLLIKDEEENDEDELVDGEDDEVGELDSDSIAGDDESDEGDEISESVEITGDDDPAEDGNADVDENSFDKN